MERCVIAAVYLNYDNISQEQLNILDSIYLLKEIKLLLLSPNISFPSYQLPMIEILTKQNKTESIKDGIRKILGVKSKKTVLKMTEVSLAVDSLHLKLKSPLMIVFLNSIECEGHLLNNAFKSEFIPLTEFSNISIGEQSMDYIQITKKWIKTQSIYPSSLLEWFRPSKRGDVQNLKQKQLPRDKSSERLGYKHDNEVLYKSTSLGTISQPQFINSEKPYRKQADSLDRIAEKDKSSNSIDLKNVFKSKITKPKMILNQGPVSAVPLQEKNNNNLVIENPLNNSKTDFFWQSDIVIRNPFWNQQKPDLSQIKTVSKSLFYKENNVIRSRPWLLDYPLHSAVYKGDMHLVLPLIDKGYSCMQRDHAGWAPFHYAVWYGHIDIVSLFINSHLVSVNFRTEDLQSPLHLSILSRQTAITKILLKQPDIDVTLKNNVGKEARDLAEKYDKQFFIPLLEFVPPKLARIQVNLMDNTVRSLVLSNGLDTSFQQLRLQMLEMLNIPYSCFEVFSFWVSFRTPKYTGKESVIPVSCFGSPSIAVKDLKIIDFKLIWKRNIFLGLNIERKVKHPLVVSLLYEEAVLNFTKKSHYPCETKDIALLSSVLLYLHLPSTEDDLKNLRNRRAVSLNRVNRPLSFILSSKLTVQSRQMSASMQTLKDRPKFHYCSSSFNDLTEKNNILDQRNRQAKTFLSSYKNMALIMPKKKLKNTKINWAEEIFKKYQQSSCSFRNHSFQEREYRFLTLCWNLTLYGCAYFHVAIKFNTSIPFADCIFAINDVGVYFLHARTKNLMQNFKYASITWHTSIGDKCILLFTKKNNIYIKSKHSLIISQLMLKLHSINI